MSTVALAGTTDGESSVNESNEPFSITTTRLHHEILEFVSFLRPTVQERTARQCVFRAIARVLRRRYPKGEVNLFGSVAHELCLPDSDLDICIRIDGKLQDDIHRSLFQLSRLLKGAGISNDIQVKKWAKVPIIALTTTPELASVRVDIGFNNVEGVIAIDIINGYLSRMPALRPLVMVVKAFLAQRGLNCAAKAGLSSYALICMAISFLQLNPTNLPVDFIEKPLETESLGTLVVDFFYYYGNTFPYESSYISVTEGKLLPKSSARWITNTLSDHLAVQCLVRADNDVAKSAGKIEVIKAAFRRAHEKLTSTSPPDIQVDRCLGRIITISQTMLDHRKHVQTVVDSGRLDAALSSPHLRWSALENGSVQRNHRFSSSQRSERPFERRRRPLH